MSNEDYARLREIVEDGGLRPWSDAVGELLDEVAFLESEDEILEAAGVVSATEGA